MFEKNHDILLHPKGATTMPTGIKVLVCDDDAAFCQKMADLVRRNQPEDGSSVAVTICCRRIPLPVLPATAVSAYWVPWYTMCMKPAAV